MSRLFLKKHSLVPYVICVILRKKINKAKAEKIPFQKKIKCKAETGYKDIEISDFIFFKSALKTNSTPIAKRVRKLLTKKELAAYMQADSTCYGVSLGFYKNV